MSHDPLDAPAFAPRFELAAAEARPVTLEAAGTGFRNFLGAVPAGQHYSAGGLIGADGRLAAERRAELHESMRLLASRFSASAQAAPGADESAIPSGYTYLLQFMAHDLVDTAATVRVELSPPGLVLSNARRELLTLETIYGAGPAHIPLAYEPEALDLDFPDVITRQRLRLGRQLARPDGSRLCPGLDIARGLSADTSVEGRVRTDALIADPRNDAHALVSQMTVLFHLLHNAVVDLLDNHRPSGRPRSLEAEARFQCARLATTLIYRAIIMNDVLPRLLDEGVGRRYLAERKPLLDAAPGLPLEFSHGVFRAAHAMVRDSYEINYASPRRALRLSDALLVSSKRALGKAPMTPSWIVDWALFFDTEAGPAANRALRLKPRYANALSVELPAKHPQRDYQGLAARDILGASYARMWSVPRLAAVLAGRLDGLVGPFASGALAAWLSGEPRLAAVAQDPPWPLFVLWEAWHSNGGERLGPIGSVILAETILGAMHQFPVAGGPFDSLGDRIELCCERLIGMPGALADIAGRGIDTMPKLLAFLATRPGFRGP